MEGYEASTYGERFAEVYDDWYPELGDDEACVACLAELAASAGALRAPAPGAPPHRPVVLELGVGTGRLALPLAAAGLDVRGTDISPAMLDRLRAKPGAGAVALAHGDMSEPAVPIRPGEAHPPAVDLAFVAYNTLFNLPDAESQQRCLTGVARVLAPTGRFVVEAFVPDLHGGSSVSVRTLTADRLVLSASVVDVAEQTLSGQFVDITEAGIRLRPWHLRYLTPAQLDDLAGRVGLSLEHRWGGWRAQPFTDASDRHVSVYRRQA